MEAKHTATPWTAEKSQVGNYTGFDINCAAPGNKKWIASVHSEHTLTSEESPELVEKKAKSIAAAEANAAFIVHACNAHDDLVKALLDLEKANDEICRLRTHEQYLSMINGGQQDALIALDNARFAARAVLAKAGAAC